MKTNIDNLIVSLSSICYIQKKDNRTVNIFVNRPSKVLTIAQVYGLEIVKSKLLSNGRCKASLRIK